MPKRWKIVKGGSYTWQYVDEDGQGNVREVLAESRKSWDEEDDVDKEIDAMRKADTRKKDNIKKSPCP
ncbi:MAG: hypothetical protein ACRDKA_13685 [Actinomycetota bacterium]